MRNRGDVELGASRHGRRFSFQFGADLLLVLALVLASWKFMAGLEYFRDVALGDESLYLTSGYRLASGGVHARASAHLYAPLYSIWYFVLSQFERDPLALFYLNHRVQSGVICVLLFGLMRRYGVGLPTSAAISFAYLVSHGNTAILPRVSHVAVAVILVSLFAGTYLRTPLGKGCALAAGALAASFARPELFLGFLLFVPWIVLATYSAWVSLGARSLLPPVMLALLATGLIASFGLPLDDTARSSLAFRQHFAVNWVALNESDIAPWSEYHRVAEAVFGDPNVGLAGALVANPGAIGMHALMNSVQIPKVLLGIFFYHAAVVLPDSMQMAEAVLLLVLVLGMLAFTIKRVAPSVKEHFRESQDTFVGLLCLLAPLVISMILIYPRQHYALQAGFIVLVAAAILMSRRSERRTPLWQAAAVAVLLVILTPSAAQLLEADPELKTRRSIEAIRALDIRDPVNLLEPHAGLAVYLGDNFNSVPRYWKRGGQGYTDFAEAYDVNAVYWVADWETMDRYSDDAEWQAFVNDSGAYGFRPIPIKGVEAALLLHESLIVSPE